MKNYTEMSDELRSSLRLYLLGFAALAFAITILPKLAILYRALFHREAQVVFTDELLKIAGVTAVVLVQAVFAFVASLLVDSEVHTYLDKMTFQLRKSTTEALIGSLTRACYSHDCQFVERIDNNHPLAMRHFYFLEEESNADLSYVFDRWKRYYLTLYLLVASGAISVVQLGLGLVWLHERSLFVASATFLVVAVCFFVSIVFHLKTRLVELATSSPARLLGWNSTRVREELLRVCEVPTTMCPWAQDAGRTLL